MADYEDTKVKDLIINNMSQEKFDELKAAGELDPTQIYLTPTEESGGSASLPDQTGNAGKFLQTDGTTASWGGGSVEIIRTSIGYNARAYSYGVAVGNDTDAEYGMGCVLIGAGAEATSAGYSIAIGCKAVSAAKNAIQLGSSTSPFTGHTNSDENTFKVGNANGNFEMMSADGTIPTDRYTITPTTAGTYVPKLTIAGDGTATREWGPESGGAGGDYLPLSGGEISGAINYNAGELQTYSWKDAPLFTATFASPSGTLTYNKAGLYADANGISIGVEDSSFPMLQFRFKTNRIEPKDGEIELGSSSQLFKSVGTKKLVSGFDTSDYSRFEIIVPEKKGTLALVEDINNIVEVLPTADNGYTTVKNFGNGYVEITGYAAIGTVGAGTGSEIQIDLPAGYTMANANYWVNIAPTSETTMFDLKAEAKARSTTHFMVAYKNEDTVTGLTAAGVYWEVRGMLATTEA